LSAPRAVPVRNRPRHRRRGRAGPAAAATGIRAPCAASTLVQIWLCRPERGRRWRRV